MNVTVKQIFFSGRLPGWVCETNHLTCQGDPSINFLYPLNPTRGCGGAGVYPSCHWPRDIIHPGQVASPYQGYRDKPDKQPSTLTLTPRDNLESPVDLTCMFLGGGRKPEYP